MARCVAPTSCFTRWALDFGCWSWLIITFLHWNAFCSIGFRLVCISATIFAGFGTIWICIRPGRAFNAGNGSWFGGVESGCASSSIGGFAFAIMSWITFFRRAINIVWTRRNRIARRGTFVFVAKSAGAVLASGFTWLALKRSFQAILAHCTAVGTIVWILFPGRAFVALVWTG